MTSFSFILFHFFSPDLTSIFVSSSCLVFGFFCSSVNPTASLNSISSLPGLEVEICLHRSSVGGQEHVKGQAGGRLDLKASSG